MLKKSKSGYYLKICISVVTTLDLYQMKIFKAIAVNKCFERVRYMVLYIFVYKSRNIIFFLKTWLIYPRKL